MKVKKAKKKSSRKRLVGLSKKSEEEVSSAGKPFECEDCGAHFRNNAGLAAHRSYKHGDKAPTPPPKWGKKKARTNGRPSKEEWIEQQADMQQRKRDADGSKLLAALKQREALDKRKVSGRAQALRVLDMILREDESVLSLENAFRDLILQAPLTAMKEFIMPLLPKEAVLQILTERTERPQLHIYLAPEEPMEVRLAREEAKRVDAKDVTDGQKQRTTDAA